ncbi:alanine racemase [uncultured Maribacter sp.]|uniref:alanine racemase n=1 Tax=uncultured Maribacter sp. TaxID=431308 RepID=UPI00262341FE|nr:alanine racemase [uncultured Maribacter sp.]
MAKTQETVLEISMSALEHNYNFITSKIKPTTKFLAVTKAFAYGSDACKIAKKLESLGVDYFAVAYTKEGVELRNSGIKSPILVLHPQAVNFKTVLKYNLEPNLYSKKILEEFLEVAKQENKSNYPIHIKFNTGLNRLGFTKEAIPKIISIIKSNSTLHVQSIFSHLAASEDLNEKKFTQGQIKQFCEIKEEIEKLLSYPILTHMANTSGILNYPEAHFSMVRSGIGLYGYGNNPYFDKKLKPVATLKTIISQKHILEPGKSIGYNRAFIADKTIVTATLPIGHADGIGRQYGKGKTFVEVNGKKALIIGNVCMDMIMIDVTNIECEEGDEVIIFGPEQSAEDFAKTANTISYELLTGIASRVKRTFLI